MNKKVYFAGSIRGGRDDVQLYNRIIQYIGRTDRVLTEHIGDVQYSTAGRTVEDDRRIYDQDTGWLKTCDLVIAECSQPSLGVGYEMAYAEKLGKPVYIFCREGVQLSAMLRGDEYFHIETYASADELPEKIDRILGNP